MIPHRFLQSVLKNKSQNRDITELQSKKPGIRAMTRFLKWILPTLLALTLVFLATSSAKMEASPKPELSAKKTKATIECLAGYGDSNPFQISVTEVNDWEKH